jgi:very-short-patch-repair endonuclease
MRKASSLEKRFSLLWRAFEGPKLETEYRFHPVRKWRADFAHLPSKTLIEIEGGVWSEGRHTRGSGFVKDAEKYLEATLAGWRVIRLAGSMITSPTVKRLVWLCIEKTVSEK